MSDTPRTDAACKLDSGSSRKPKWRNLLNESRKLERELAQVNSQLDAAKQLHDGVTNELKRVKKEMDQHITNPDFIFPRREPDDLEIWTISARFLKMVRSRVEEITGDANNSGYEDILLCAEKCLIDYEEEMLAEAEYQLQEDEKTMVGCNKCRKMEF